MRTRLADLDFPGMRPFLVRMLTRAICVLPNLQDRGRVRSEARNELLLQ